MDFHEAKEESRKYRKKYQVINSNGLVFQTDNPKKVFCESNGNWIFQNGIPIRPEELEDDTTGEKFF